MTSNLELEFKAHYKAMDQASGAWSGLRIRRLCKLLRLSQSELARLIRVNPWSLKQAAVFEKIPSHVRLLLELVERAAHGKYLGKTYDKSLMPHI